jgi:hypothetical protein
MKTAVFVGMSLDGFIARENDELDWLHDDGAAGSEDFGYKGIHPYGGRDRHGPPDSAVRAPLARHQAATRRDAFLCGRRAGQSEYDVAT